MKVKTLAISEQVHKLGKELVEHEKKQSPGLNYTLGQLTARLYMQEHKKVFKNGKAKN